MPYAMETGILSLPLHLNKGSNNTRKYIEAKLLLAKISFYKNKKTYTVLLSKKHQM